MKEEILKEIESIVGKKKENVICKKEKCWNLQKTNWSSPIFSCKKREPCN